MEDIESRWDPDQAKPTYHEVPARHQHFERLDSEDELRGIEEACFIRWSTAAQDAADLASEPSTSSRYRAQGDGKGAELPTPRLTKRRLKATQVQADMIWRKYYIPASRLPELLAQREEQHTKFKELQSKSTEAKNKWHRAFDFMMEGNDVDRALRNVRDISSKIRQYMFFGESENAVLKLQSTLAQYHRTWDQKRYGRLTAGLSDIARLAYPIEQLIDTRTFECHEIVQQELSVAIQNELTRRAEPMELQRMDRETDNVLQQSEVARSSINRKLDDLRHSIQRTARDAGAFIQRVKMTLQQVLADINEFTTAHANMKKAEKDYKADMFDQQRRNDGYKESLEKLEARRKLAEARLQADLETLRSEHTILRRTLETLIKMHEESRTRATEIASWLQVLAGQRLERTSELMLDVHELRIRRRRAMFKRLHWLDVQRIVSIVAQLRARLATSSEKLRKARLQKEVELYRSITSEAKVLKLELRGRCRELNGDGTVKDAEALQKVLKGAEQSCQGFFSVLAEELHAQAQWLRRHQIWVGLSAQTFTLIRPLKLATPLTLLNAAIEVVKKQEVQLMVITDMRRASMHMEEKVLKLTERFKLALLSRRHSVRSEDSESLGHTSSDENEEEEEEEGGMDAAKLRQILEHQQHGDLLESETTSDEAEHVAPSGGSVEDALLHLQELSGVEDQLHRALAHLLHKLHGTPKMEEVHDLLKTKVQELSEAWHLAVTITAHCVPHVDSRGSTTWKIREQRFAWLVPLVHQLAQRCGELRAVGEVLWAEAVAHGGPQRLEALEKIKAVLRSLAPFPKQIIQAGEESMTRVQKGLREKLHIMAAAKGALEHLSSLPDANVAPSEGVAEMLPLGPSSHTFLTAVKALMKFLTSDALADAKVFDRLTGPEILGVLSQAVTGDMKHALPECFRAAMLSLADLGNLIEEYEPQPVPGEDVSLVDASLIAQKGKKTGIHHQERWKALAAGARRRIESGTPLPDSRSGSFQLGNSRPLFSRERSQTAESSRPWTSTPQRPSTEGSTRLPSRQQADLTSLERGRQEQPPSPLGLQEVPLDQQNLEFELEKQRLEQAQKEQEEDLRRLQSEEQEAAQRVDVLRRTISKLSQGSDAWRVGEVLEELEKMEEARKTIQATLDECQQVTELLQEQQKDVQERQSLHHERTRIMHSHSMLPVQEKTRKAKSLQWQRSLNRLSDIQSKMEQLDREISIKQGAASNLEAKVLERQKSKMALETGRSGPTAETTPAPKILTEQEAMAIYASRVAMRSLWKVQGYKLMQAQRAAKMYCQHLLKLEEGPRVVFELEGGEKRGASSKKRGSQLRRSATKVGSRRASSTKSGSISPSPKSSTTTSRASLKRGSLQKRPGKDGTKSEEQTMYVGRAKSKITRSLTHGQPKLTRDATRRLSRASIESRADSVEAAALMESITVRRDGRATTVPVINVRSASPASASSYTSEESEEEDVELPDVPAIGRRANIMTDLLETKALRSNVQASLGEQELEQSTQWADDWIRRKSMQGPQGEDAQDVGVLDGRHLLRRTGLSEITPLVADEALGIDGLDVSDSEDEEVLQRKPESLLEHLRKNSMMAPQAPQVKPKKPGLPGRAVQLGMPLQGGSPLVVFAGKDRMRSKGSKTPKRKTTKKEAESPVRKEGFLADPLIQKLEKEFAHQPSLREKSPMSRREFSTSTSMPGDAEGLHEDSLMTFSSVLSGEKYSYLSENAIAAAVGDDPRARRVEASRPPLPKLVDVRKNGPGDAAAAQYVGKGCKAVVSAAMVQAARMQPPGYKPPRSKLAKPKAAPKKGGQAVEVETDSPILQDSPDTSRCPTVQFMEEEKEIDAQHGPTMPVIRVQTAGKSSTGPESGPASPSSSGWSHGSVADPGELGGGRSSRSAGSVLTTRPKQCQPLLSARAKKYFNGGWHR